VLFIDFAPVRITAKLCNYGAFAQKKAKLAGVVAATSKLVVDFSTGLHTTWCQIQFYMACKNIQLTSISKCHLHRVCNRHSGTEYLQRLRKYAWLFCSAASVKLAQPEHLFKTKTFVVCCKSRNHGAQFRKNGCVIFTAFAIEQFWQ